MFRPPLRWLGLAFVLGLAVACGGKTRPSSSTAKGQAKDEAKDEAKDQDKDQDEDPSTDERAKAGSAEPSDALEAYLAAIPAEPPSLSTEVTGTPGDDPATDVPRCRQTGWSYYQCARVFPNQGRQWVRWECAHGDSADTRSILCVRLAEYLYEGVGGPRQPALATALFDRACRPDQPNYRSSCYSAAQALMFDDPERALEFAKLGCGSKSESPIGCRWVVPVLEAGLRSRKVIVEQVEGLAEIAVGSECAVWLWPEPTPGSCGARLACGDAVLYGAEGSTVPCEDDQRGGEDMTHSKDGDPAFHVDGETIELRDDDSGRLGAFTLRGRVE